MFLSQSAKAQPMLDPSPWPREARVRKEVAARSMLQVAMVARGALLNFLRVRREMVRVAQSLCAVEGVTRDRVAL